MSDLKQTTSLEHSDLIKVLLVEDDPHFAILISEMLKSASSRLDAGPAYLVRSVNSFADATTACEEEEFSLALLDLSLPDSQLSETMKRIGELSPHMAVIVLTGHAEEDFGLRAVRSGAQDYLVKGLIDRELLVRSISYSLERQGLQRELRALSLRDELTGLYNRRGLFTLALEQFKSAKRLGNKLFLVFTDMDSFKEVNDNFGHDAGDKALREYAALLMRTFRESDIVSRLGGDEFVVLVANAANEENLDNILSRLYASLDRLNSVPDRPFSIKVSVGTAIFDPEKPIDIEELIAEADREMYKSKKQ